MFFWGAAFNVTEVALDHTTPAFTAFSRGAFGFLVLLPFLSAFGSRLPRTPRLWGFAAAMGFGGTTLSLAGSPRARPAPGRRSRRSCSTPRPFFVAVIGRLALHERVTALRALGLVIGFTGVITIILAGKLLERRGRRHRRGADPARSDRIRLRGPADALSLADRRAFDIMGLTAAQFLCGAIFLIPYLFRPATSEPATGTPQSCGGRSRSS